MSNDKSQALLELNKELTSKIRNGDLKAVKNIIYTIGKLLILQRDESSPGKNKNITNLILVAKRNGQTLLRPSGVLDKHLIIAADLALGDAVKILVRGDADVNAKDNEGRTALMIAARSNDTKVVEFLAERGADINAKDNEGRTALMIAASIRLIRVRNNGRIVGSVDVVEFLADRGADLEAKDNEGRTALMIAAEKGNADVVKILSNKEAVGTSMTSTSTSKPPASLNHPR